MKMRSGEFCISMYRDFYDVPRLMLVADRDSYRWIFECLFDEEADEYSDFYSVYPVGPEVSDEEAVSLHLKDGANHHQAIVPVSAMRFDESNRRSFFLDLPSELGP